MKLALSYDDVLLVPKYSTIESRQVVDLSNYLDGDTKMGIPIIASPMDTVSEVDMAVAMATAGGTAIIHRYNTIEEQESMVNRAFRTVLEQDKSSTPLIGASVGVTGGCLDRASRLIDSGASIVCVDIAHGHHILAERAIKALKQRFGGTCHLMAGNVATMEGFEDLVKWGADSVRVGIGGGSICSTRIQTGHGVPSFSSIVECVKSERSDIAIIADGGIKNSGDIVKALAAGADFVMLGSLLAGTDESPGEIIGTTAGLSKSYRGMASRAAQEEWRGESASPEGVATMIPYKGSVSDVLQDLRGGIASGLSYSGAATIEELWLKAEFIQQTAAGQFESATHILKR
jgi:IMP dehydrogenase